MDSKYVDVSSGGLLRSLRDHWRLVVVCALVGLALAGGRVLTQGSSYSAESQILVGQPLTLQTLTSGTPSNVDQTRLVDYTQRVLASDTISDRVDKRLELDSGDYTLDVLSANATSVILLRITADDADRAQAVANAFAKTYVAWVASENAAKVDRAVQHLRGDIKTASDQLLKLDQRVANADVPAATAAALAPQRTALVQQQVMLQTRLSQAQLAGAIDPAGGAQVVEQASKGKVSTFATTGQLVLGLLFGVLVGIGLAALRRPQPKQADGDEADRVLAAAPEPASA